MLLEEERKPDYLISSKITEVKALGSTLVGKYKMFGQSLSLLPQTNRCVKTQLLVTGLALGLSGFSIVSQPAQAQKVETQSTDSKAPVAVSLNRHISSNGVYLYGESSQRVFIK